MVTRTYRVFADAVEWIAEHDNIRVRARDQQGAVEMAMNAARYDAKMGRPAEVLLCPEDGSTRVLWSSAKVRAAPAPAV